MNIFREGVVAVPITKRGRILAIWDGENAGKKEKIGWDVNGNRKTIADLRQFVGGVCESDDLLADLIREGSEETELNFSPTDFIEAGVGTLIDHQRANGEVMLVGVSVFWLMLGEEMEILLKEAGAVEMTDEIELRERDMIIYSLLKDQIPTNIQVIETQ